MNRRFFALAFCALGALGLSRPVLAATELRVMVHSSFALPKPLLAQFEAEANVKLTILKGGDAGEMLNKLILTRANPVADVVFGIDNTLVAKAVAAGVLDTTPLAAHDPSEISLGPAVAAVDYGYVTLNIDQAALAKNPALRPRSLADLASPAFKGLLVMPNPATSSTGYAFLLATIAGMGEEPAFAWWAQMRANGLKVVKGWSEAYYTEFSRNKGRYPLVVSYATSPAAEVFYSKDKLSTSPTASVNVSGGVFRQIEGVALVQGGAQRAIAEKFVAFLRSGAVQQALQTEMWMYPAVASTPRAEVLQQHALEPEQFERLPAQIIASKGAQWVARWTQVVLK